MRIAETSGPRPAAPSSRDLVLMARDGDRDAFGILVARERDRLIATARALTGDHHAGEDCAQEAFVRGFRHLRELRDADRFRPWLARILVRVTRRSRWWGRPRLARLPDEIPVTPSSGDDAEEVRTALAALRPADRTVLALRYFDGLGYAEIGETLGVDAKRIKSRLHEARVRLRRRVESLRAAGERRP